MKTKRGIELAVGQVWRDCDKRQTNRKRRIVAIDEQAGRVQMASVDSESPKTWISVRRMYPHSGGWDLET